MIQVFRYMADADAFVCDETYERVARELGLAEWNPVVWIGRLFALDNDFGEHWFDNWEEAGNADERLVVCAHRFADGRDGPCHSEEQRKRFWTDILKTMRLSWETIVSEARENAAMRSRAGDAEVNLVELEERIRKLESELGGST